MVSTRRSGSIPNNNNNNNIKRSSSSSENKPPSPPSPKRQKVENGGVVDKSEEQTEREEETAKEVEENENVGEEVVGKGEVAPSVVTPVPVSQASVPVLADKPRSSFTSWKPQNQSCETATPWCRLLAQSSLNQTMTVYATSFVVGSSKNANLLIKDIKDISTNLCIIKLNEREGSSVAVLESKGGKGSVHVNGKTIKKGTTCVLKSGDEVVFGSHGNHAYIFQQLPDDGLLKTHKSSHGRDLKALLTERRTGDSSAVAGLSWLCRCLASFCCASLLCVLCCVLASLLACCALSCFNIGIFVSSLRQRRCKDVSLFATPMSQQLVPTLKTKFIWKRGERDRERFVVIKIHDDVYFGPEIRHQNHDDDVDGLEVNSATNTGNDSAAEIGATSKSTPVGSNPDPNIIETENASKTMEQARDSLTASAPGSSVRSAMLKEEILAGIIDGLKVDVSFDDFPYYLSENTKNVLIAASYIHLKHRDQVKYASDLPTVNPRILLSGPAGSEIYQEMLAKALAHYYGAKLLIFDSHSFLGGLSTKAELLKEVSPSNVPKQSPGPTTLSTSTISTPTPTELDVVLRIENLLSESPLESQQKMEVDVITPMAGTSKSPAAFKLGDRVKFIGSGSGGVHPSSSTSRGPSSGARGRVLLPFEDNHLSKIGVKFDKLIPDGVDLGGLCDAGYGYFCSANELRLDSSGVEDLDKLLISTLFEVVTSESRNVPFILFMKDAEKSIVGSSESYSTFKSSLERLPDNVVVIGSQSQTDNRKEKDCDKINRTIILESRKTASVVKQGLQGRVIGDYSLQGQ
ncbi:P-loop containing nucleoside triphosphate hydrolase superfamily protein [Tanacetum coccineum]